MELWGADRCNPETNETPKNLVIRMQTISFSNQHVDRKKTNQGERGGGQGVDRGKGPWYMYIHS